MKKLTVCLLTVMLSVCMGIQPVLAAVSTNAQSWAKESVLKAYESGIATEELLQKATSPITRAEFCRSAVDLYCLVTGTTLEKSGESPFSDCDDPYVLTAYEMKIISGMGDGTFHPNDPLTREQFCIILTKLMQQCGVTLESNASGRVFTDISGLSESSREYIQKVSDAGFISGYTDGTFLPKKSLKTEEALIVLMNVLEYVQSDSADQTQEETAVPEEDISEAVPSEESGTTDVDSAEETAPSEPVDTVSEQEKSASATVIIHGREISIGMTEEQVKKIWGEPVSVDSTVYGLERYVYHGEDNVCLLATMKDNNVIMYYALADELIWNGKAVAQLPSQIDADIRISAFTHSGIYEDSEVLVSFPLDFTGQICGISVTDYAFSQGDHLLSGTSLSLREDLAQELFVVVNTLRVLEGEEPLIWEDALASSALDHSADMIKLNYFDYNSPDGTTPFARMQKKAISFYTASEVIANARGDVPELFTELIKNTGRYNIITDETMTHAGIGVASSTKTLYMTMDMCGFAD